MGCNQSLIPLLSSLSGSKRLARIRREDSEELVTAEDDLLEHAEIEDAHNTGRSRTGEGDPQGNEPIDHGTCENSTVPRLGPRIQPSSTVSIGDEVEENYHSGSKACKIAGLHRKLLQTC